MVCVLNSPAWSHHNHRRYEYEAVQSFQPPQNVKHVQQFLGICNYYRRFIRDFAKISQPIAKLIQKDELFVWSSDCDAAFNL